MLTPSRGAVVYDADAGPDGLSAWATMLKDVARSRTLIWYLAARDFKGQYKQSLLGYATALVPPLAAAAVFTFVARKQLLPLGNTSLPYPLYVLLGMTVWGLFSGVVGSTTGSLGGAANLIKKMKFPREAVVFAALAQPLTDTAIRAVPVTIFIFVYGVHVRAITLLLPFVLLPLVLLALGLGFMLTVLNALARDVSTTVGLALQLGLLLTPVVYPPPTSWPFVLINYVNPVSAFVTATQDLVATGQLSMPAPLFASTLLGWLAFLVGWRLFRLAQPIIGDRL